ncbi:MAG: alpha-amylase family protein [Bryobacteraceae bacterium]
MTRRSFAKSVGLAAGLGSIPAAGEAQTEDAAPDVPMPTAASGPNGLRFRQVHLDFHTSPLIADVGADFDASAFAQTLKDASVNSINIFAKCHHGMAYYPSKVGPVHPGLKFDLLGEMITACHKADILTPVYITVLWDQYAAEQHADWRVLDEHGAVDGAAPLEPGWKRVCANTPYLDYVSAQAEEVARNYEVDGFWFDIVRYSSYGCFCHYCIQEREKLGLDSSKPEDRARHAQMVILRTMDRLESAVRRHRPHAATFFNGQVRVGMRPYLKHYTQIEIESLPGGGWGYAHFAVMSRYVRNFGLEYLGMDARFHRTWGDFGALRNQAALDYECFRMLAQAGKCSMGDQMHPRGRLLKPVYDRIGRTYKSVAEKEPWCVGARAVTEIGFLSTATTLLPGVLATSDVGVTNMLAELHHQFDALDRESDFSRYKVLILPDTHRFDPDLLRQVRSYVAGGGKLILSHESGLDVDGKQFAMEEMGVDYAGPSPYQGDRGDYFEVLEGANEDIDPMVQFTYAPGSMVKARPGTTVLARAWKAYFDRTYEHFSSHHQTPYDQPTEQAAAAQHGGIIYIAFPIFESYANNAYRVHKLLVRNCLRRLLPDPLVKADLPSTAEATVTEQGGKRIVHLLHYPASRRCPDLDVVEDAIPLANVKIALRTAKEPSRVYLAPQRRSLRCAFADGYAQVVVPSVQGHQMVVFES